MKKRSFPIIFLLMSMILSVCSCGGTAEETETPADTGQTAAVQETETAIVPSVESCDYGGQDFHVYAPALPHGMMYTDYYFADEQTGDQMNDAIYQRRMLVEDYLGVTLKHTFSEQDVMKLGEEVNAFVMSGDDIYQMVLTHQFHCNYFMLTEGLLYNWYNVPTIDLEKPWWNQFCNENLELAGRLYFAMSDFMLSESMAILFNKGIAEDFNLENPYDMVREGTWTLENMFSLAEKVKVDLDGNGVMDINDQYGFGIRKNARLNGFLYASDIFVSKKDEDGNLQLAINSERTVKLVELFADMMYNSDYSYIWAEEDVGTLKIDTGRVLFHGELLQKLKDFRESEVDIGILPYPKFDEAQQKYNAMEWSGLMSLPVTIQDPEMVGKVVEMLSYYSAETTIPAYYDVLLGEKFSRDPDSREMLELIFDNITVDAGMNCFAYTSSMNAFFYTLMKGITNGTSTFASYYASHEAKALEEIHELMEIVKALPN